MLKRVTKLLSESKTCSTYRWLASWGQLRLYGISLTYSQTGVKERFLVRMGSELGLMLAIQYDKHNTIGQDCGYVSMTSSLQVRSHFYFLDYIATGKMKPAKLEQVVAGAEGCVHLSCLIMAKPTKCLACICEDDYDLAGFAKAESRRYEVLKSLRVMSFRDWRQVGNPFKWLFSRSSCFCGLYW